MVHIILSLVLAKSISNDSFVVPSLQQLGDFFLTMEMDLETAKSCYQTAAEYLKDEGYRRHFADCAFRFGIILLLDGKEEVGKQKLTNSLRIYELAGDIQGHSYCKAILAECEVEGPKVRQTAKHY